MNTQLKSHWKLAFRTTKKALQVTWNIFFHGFKANHYSMMTNGKLERQRDLFNLIEERK